MAGSPWSRRKVATSMLLSPVTSAPTSMSACAPLCATSWSSWRTDHSSLLSARTTLQSVSVVRMLPSLPAS